MFAVQEICNCIPAIVDLFAHIHNTLTQAHTHTYKLTHIYTYTDTLTDEPEILLPTKLVSMLSTLSCRCATDWHILVAMATISCRPSSGDRTRTKYELPGTERNTPRMEQKQEFEWNREQALGPSAADELWYSAKQQNSCCPAHWAIGF